MADNRTGDDILKNPEALPDGEPAGVLPALRRRRLWRRLRGLLWLLLLVPFIYLAVQIFIIVAPRMRTDVVMLDTMTDALAVRGMVVLDSAPVTGPQGYLYYSVPTGQRVTAENEVARVFASEAAVRAMDRLEEVNAETEMLLDAQRTVVDSGDLDILLGQMQNGLYSLLADIETGDYADLAPARGEITLASNKIQVSTRVEKDFEGRISELSGHKQRLEAAAAAGEVILAPETGYFVPSPARDRRQTTPEAAEKLSPARLKARLEAAPTYYGGDVVGHIVRDYKWYFYTVVPIADAEKFVEGDKGLQLTFPDAGEVTVPVTVERVEEDASAGIALVKLLGEYMSPEILSLRVENAEVVFGVRKGIRIEKNALRLADVQNEDGSLSTFMGVYVKFGNMVYFRRIDILVEDEYYMLVSGEYVEGVSEVRLYDEVVMDSGGVELYDRKIL